MVITKKRKFKKSSNVKGHLHSGFHSSHSSHSTHSQSSHADFLADAYRKLKAGRSVAAGHAEHPSGPHVSIREIEYKGHRIVIQTHYNIRVDGKPLSGHVYVDNEGMVSTHAFPAYSFSSTVDLVKKLVDAFPNEFGKKTKGKAGR